MFIVCCVAHLCVLLYNALLRCNLVSIFLRLFYFVFNIAPLRGAEKFRFIVPRVSPGATNMLLLRSNAYIQNFSLAKESFFHFVYSRCCYNYYSTRVRRNGSYIYILQLDSQKLFFFIFKSSFYRQQDCTCYQNIYKYQW